MQEFQQLYMLPHGGGMEMNMINDITFKPGNEKLLDETKELWEELNQLHLEKSHDFKKHYASYTFQMRKDRLNAYAGKGKLSVMIAYDKDVKIGYCIASVVDGVGEIDSIYITPDYRDSHVGSTLINISLNWIKLNNTKKIIVAVSAGNEEVLNFYSQFGFAPRLTQLEMIR